MGPKLKSDSRTIESQIELDAVAEKVWWMLIDTDTTEFKNSFPLTRRQAARSKIPAAPIPPPTHMVTRP